MRAGVFQVSISLDTAFTKQYAYAVGHRAFCGTDKGHLKTGGPPGADCNQGFCGADCKVRGQRDDCRGDDRLEPMHEEEGDDRNTGPNSGRESTGTGRDQRVGECFFRGAKALAGQST